MADDPAAQITPDNNPYLVAPPPEDELTRKEPPASLPPVSLEEPGP